jgi:signal transduction histidine kinase
MNRVKIASSLVLVALVFFSIFYLYMNILDIYENRYLIAEVYSELVSEDIDDRVVDILVALNDSSKSIYLNATYLLHFGIELVLLIALIAFFYYLSKGEIFVEKNLKILKIVVLIFCLQMALVPMMEIWYIDTVNEMTGLECQGHSSFFEDSIYSVVLICVLLIVLWIFLESINMKKKSDEYEMQKRFLIQQHKLSQLGQLLGFITHEWKEPLNRISSYIVSIHMSDGLDKQIESKLNKCEKQIEHMYETMSNFKSFYSSSSTKEYFSFDKPIYYIINLLKDELLMENIDIEFSNSSSLGAKGSWSELSQVILILINNSKDAFKAKSIQDKRVSINIEDNIIYYKDTAKGVDESMIKDIFLPEVTSKKDSSGMGLYIAKLILAEKFDATISVKNTPDGLEFCIVLPKEDLDG